MQVRLKRLVCQLALWSAALLPTLLVLMTPLHQHWGGLTSATQRLSAFELHVPPADSQEGGVGGEGNCASVFSSVMEGHQALLQLAEEVQQGISSTLQCRASGPTALLGLLGNPICWHLAQRSPLADVGCCLLGALLLALLATLSPTSLPLTLLALQLDIMVALYCYEVGREAQV